MSDWRLYREDLEHNMIDRNAIRAEPVPMQPTTSRAGGYNPTRLYIGGQFKETWDVHPETDPIMYLFYSGENIARLQDECERRGMGRPGWRDLRYYQDLVLSEDRYQFNRECFRSEEEYMALIRECVATANENVIRRITPVINANRFGYQQFYLALNNIRNIPDHPVSGSARRSDIPLQFPYYNNLY